MCCLNKSKVLATNVRVTIVISSHWWGLGEDVIPFRCYGKLSRLRWKLCRMDNYGDLEMTDVQICIIFL